MTPAIYTLIVITGLICYNIISRDRKRSKADREVSRIYDQIWTGKEPDRLTAWHRCRAHVESFNTSPCRAEMLEIIEQHINELWREQNSKLVTAPSGRRYRWYTFSNN